MNRPLRIGIDVDDVTNNFLELWIKIWNEKTKHNTAHLNISDIKDWDLRKVVSKEDYESFLRIPSTQEFYDQLEACPFSQIVINELLDSDCEVFFITGTYSEHAALKENWITKHFPLFDKNRILFVKNGNKNLVNVDVMIEDCPLNIDKYEAVVLLLDKPYNKFNYKHNVHRVFNWFDIRNIFVEKFNLLPITSDSLEVLNALAELEKDIKSKDTQEEIDSNENNNENINEAMYNFGYTSALKDLLKTISEMAQNFQKK